MTDNEIIQQYKKYEPFFGSWYIKRFVGEGGFAKVFEIVRNDFGNEYNSALKIITVSKTKTEIDAMRNEGMSDKDIKDSLYGIVEDTVREIQLMYKLRGNGNIVGYEDHAVIEHEGGLGWDILIKMEFLTSLGGYTRQNKGQIAKRNVIKLGIDICKALEACQKLNIIHRDIKADNIFISQNGDFKLGDFGIARVIERKDMELSKKGTFTYMAPEVYKGQTYTSAVDIYSLGMVLYRLMNNNRAPFLPAYPKSVSLDDRDQALMQRMSGEQFPKPNQVEKSRLTEIAIKACAFRPEDRYSSPLSMRQELESILYDQEEMAGDEMIMIYEDQGEESSFSFSKSIQASPQSEDGATEILKGEATEVLREDTADSAANTDAQSASAKDGAVKILCKNCGNAINRDAAFCPVCGAGQRQESEVQEKEKEKVGFLKKLPKNTPLIAGISAAVLVLAVIIGVVVSNFSSKEDPEESGSSVVQESVESTPTPEPTAPPNPWKDNILMAAGMVEDADLPLETDPFLGTDILREEIVTITFLDSLDQMPENAWDVSADGSGKVMAWAVPRDGGYYDFYIGGKGGVSANEDAKALFANLVNVEQIYISGCFHTENTNDMSGMFFQCYSLKLLDVSGFDTSNVTDMNGMFIWCENLTELDVSGFDTSNVMDMNYMFFQCSSVTRLDVENFDTSKVTNMASMFEQCNSVASLDVSGFQTAGVRDMNSMFYGCANLTSLDVSSFNTASVTDMMGMFGGCGRLTQLDLSNFNTSKTTDMSAMFINCENLVSVDVSSFDTSKVIDLGYMFGGCHSLTNVDVSGFDTSNTTDLSYMFAECTKLTHVDVSGFNTSKVTNAENMFVSCTNLTGLDLSSFSPDLAASTGAAQEQQVAGGDITGDSDFSDAYHDDFTPTWEYLGYQSEGWHETYVYANNPNMAMHLLYLKPYGDLVTESGFLWEGPVMDSYKLEEDIRLNLYQDRNGQQIARLRILTLDMDVKLQYLEDEDMADLFEAELMYSNVTEDTDQLYGKKYAITSSWNGGATGLLYAVQDYSTGIIYTFEYVIINSMYVNMDPIDALLDTMTPVNFADYDIDPKKGILEPRDWAP